MSEAPCMDTHAGGLVLLRNGGGGAQFFWLAGFTLSVPCMPTS